MIRIGILGDIGSGKSFLAKKFGFPVFSADSEVGNIYKKDKKIFKRLKKILPKYFYSFPIEKKNVLEAILAKKNNLDKITKIVHIEVRRRMNIFLLKNRNKKAVILDIPLLLENKINKKRDILVFVEAKNQEILKRLKKRNNFNKKLIHKFKKIQLPLAYKKKRSHFIIKNDFSYKSVKNIKLILNKVL